MPGKKRLRAGKNVAAVAGHPRSGKLVRKSREVARRFLRKGRLCGILKPTKSIRNVSGIEFTTVCRDSTSGGKQRLARDRGRGRSGPIRGQATSAGLHVGAGAVFLSTSDGRVCRIARLALVAKPGAGPPAFTGLAARGRRQHYFEITPQAIRIPAFPAGSVFRSSAFS
jgi:hypothetical protein